MSDFSMPCRVWLLVLAALGGSAGSGCTTVLSTASLRDMVLGIDDRADDDTIPDSPTADSDATDEQSDAVDAERREAAIEEAVSRLSKVDSLDDAARATLVATLQRTDQEDWPVVVDAFAESLADMPASHVVAKADLDAAISSPESLPEAPAEESTAAPESVPAPAQPVKVAEPVPAAAEPAVAVSVAPGAEPPSPPEPVPADTPSVELAPAPTLAIQNASFASRVQAWGVLDRFAANRFRPGQEVIIYFELENLSSGESAAGHTTCIDSQIRLLTNRGDTIHQWTFEPIAETCRARRHDYFARYMLRIPADAEPGQHRVELAVTDTLSGQKAVESIDLEIFSP